MLARIVGLLRRMVGGAMARPMLVGGREGRPARAEFYSTPDPLCEPRAVQRELGVALARLELALAQHEAGLPVAEEVRAAGLEVQRLNARALEWVDGPGRER